MTEPIINPWLFYLLDIVNSLNILFVVIFILLVFVLGVMFCLLLADELEAKDLPIKPTLIATTIILLGLIFIPSRNTLIAMAVAKHITPQNLEAAGETADKAIDKLIDKIVKTSKEIDKK